MNTFIPLLFAAILAILSILCLSTALRWRKIQRGFRPENELRVYGKLIQFERHPKAYRGRHGRDTPTDIWDFTYAYEVDGKTYTHTDRLVKNGIRLPSGTEIVCQRSDPKQCHIPGLTPPPTTEAHHTLYFCAGFCLFFMLFFLSRLF